MAGILTALLSGALMSIQGVFNTEVTKQTSTWFKLSAHSLKALESMKRTHCARRFADG